MILRSEFNLIVIIFDLFKVDERETKLQVVCLLEWL